MKAVDEIFTYSTLKAIQDIHNKIKETTTMSEQTLGELIDSLQGFHATAQELTPDDLLRAGTIALNALQVKVLLQALKQESLLVTGEADKPETNPDPAPVEGDSQEPQSEQPAQEPKQP